MDEELTRYLEQIDPSLREQFRQNIDGFKAWRLKVAEEEATARAMAEEQGGEAAGEDAAGGAKMGDPGDATRHGKRAMQQEDVEGAASKLEEAIQAETLSPDDVQAVVEATRRRLNKKLRLG